MTEEQPANIILIGYRGSGKTTVGRLLAERLGWSFVDTDALVEAVAAMTIAEIFAAEGEGGFRARERDAINAVVEKTRQVVAVGGGATTDQRNVDRLRSAGKVIWLTAPPEVLWKRIAGDPESAATRPDLTASGGVEEVRKVLAAREASYEAAADLRIDTQGRSASEVANAVEAAMGTAL